MAETIEVFLMICCLLLVMAAAVGMFLIAVDLAVGAAVDVIEWFQRRRSDKGAEPRRMRTSIVLLTFAAAVVGCEDEPLLACNRCGLFGTRCRYASTYVAPAAVAPIVAPSNVYVVQNSYPQPLVGQGTSAVVSNGGYQSLALPLFDPTSYFSQSLQLIKAANDTSALQHERTSNLVERVAALQAPAVERLAAGQAASLVLKSAGLDPAHNTQGQSSAVVISRDASGAMQVLPLDAGQVQRITAAATSTSSTLSTQQTTITTTGAAAVSSPERSDYPLLAQYCAKCHGVDVASPKGGFYLGDDENVAVAMRGKFFEIVNHVSKGTMPPAEAPQPSAQEKSAILDEVQRIIVKRTKGKG